MAEETDLKAHEVHIWSAKLSDFFAELAYGYSLLSEKEQLRADRFVVAAPREQYIAATWILRQILASYLKCRLDEVEFKFGSHGKPYVLQATDLQFNLSHSQDRVLIGIAKNQEIGVDIEYHKSRRLEVELLAQRFFTSDECTELMQHKSSHRFLAFYRIWTRKEAFIKATGQGLSFGLNNFSVSSKRQGFDCLLTINESAKLAQQWSLGPILEREQDYTAAVAAFGEIRKLKYQQWLPKSFEK